MDLQSLTILLIFLFFISFFLAGVEALITSKNIRINSSTTKRQEPLTHLDTIGKAIPFLELIVLLVNASIIAIFTIIITETISSYLILSLCILLLLIALYCILIPKILAVKYPKVWKTLLAKPVLLILWLAKPLWKMSDFLSEKIIIGLIPKKLEPNEATSDEEFAELIDLAYQQGIIERSEREILNEIIKLDQKTAEEVMKPRSDMVCIEDTSDLSTMISFSKRHNYTRIPIYNETPDNVVGILNTRKLLLSPDDDVSEAIEFPSFVPSTMNLMNLLQSLQKQRRGLAIVLDEFGGTAGLITIEDILEELVGEMREEGEQIEFTVEKLHWNRWRVNGTLPIEDFQRIVPELKAVPEVDTMGGLVAALNEVVPETGESLNYCSLEFSVVSADERRVKELIVKRLMR